MTSPSEQYARWAQEKAALQGELGAFAARFPFPLDDFQLEAGRSLEQGRSVLVAAPTGAGKTVVGEFAVHLAVASGRKVFYTAPIKALSNQKFGELSRWLGEDRVGLLTGDTSIHPEAQVVVMTTEVLRNMLYAESDLLDGLSHVVMDEVHYLADRMRGPVWEEVIINLAPEVRLVALSATVSNAEEFGAWLQEVRGDTEIIVSEVRPVPLWQHVVIGEKLFDLFVDDEGRPVVSHGPGAHGHREVNPLVIEATTVSARLPQRGGPERPGRHDGERSGRYDEHRGGGRRSGAGRRSPRGKGRGRGRGSRDHRGHGHGGGRYERPAPERPQGRGGGIPRPPRRPEVLELLDDDGLLPAICFIFSRAGCDAAVRQCRHAGLRLTDDAERRAIRAILDERLGQIPLEDEEILGIHAFRRSALDGVAAHHAGMIPLLKVVVEELFARGLVKVVFATETLALGINMPARSVVLEKLSKFNGIEHADLTPGEYTQLTGRAGRRGIDVEGHAVVVAGPGFDPEAVASLASRRTYPLRSAFRPTPNMVVNLLERSDPDRARAVIETSFAQFQADRGVVGLARRARELEDTAASYREPLQCERGDLPQYARIQERIAEREKELSRARGAKDRESTLKALRRLSRGDVLAIPGGRRNGYAVVVDVDRDVLGGPQVDLLGPDGRRRSIRPGDLPSPPAVIDAMKLPRPERLGSAKVRRDTGSALRAKLAGHDDDPRREVRRRVERAPSTAATDPELTQLRAELRQHPCAQCPELEAHLRWVGRLRGTEAELASVRRRIQSRTSSLARAFDHLCSLLAELGYLAPDEHEHLRPTRAGLRLRRLYSERDVMVAECLERGAWTGLTPAGLAAVVSAAVHESRRDDGGAPELTEEPAVEAALAATMRIAAELQSAEVRHGVDPTPAPDAALSAVVHAWARGSHLAAALEGTTLAAGDFVRHCRQVIDMLDQLVPDREVGATARAAIAGIRRGLVAQEIDR